MRELKFFITSICLCQLCFCGAFWAFRILNLRLFLSFEFAFFSTLLVVLSSFLNYKKNILSRAKTHTFKNKPLFIFVKKMQKNAKILNFRTLKDDLKPNFKEKMQNFALFFPLVKILSYGILVAGFLFLKSGNLLSILGYLSGISAFFVCVLFFVLSLKYES